MGASREELIVSDNLLSDANTAVALQRTLDINLLSPNLVAVSVSSEGSGPEKRKQMLNKCNVGFAEDFIFPYVPTSILCIQMVYYKTNVFCA